jgi:hypothetical protein
MDMKMIGKWLFVIGWLVAVIAALAGLTMIPVWILALVGFVSGLLHPHGDDAKMWILVFLGLSATAASLGEVPAVGSYLTGLFSTTAWFIGTVVLGSLTMWLVGKLMGMVGMGGDKM